MSEGAVFSGGGEAHPPGRIGAPALVPWGLTYGDVAVHQERPLHQKLHRL